MKRSRLSGLLIWAWMASVWKVREPIAKYLRQRRAFELKDAAYKLDETNHLDALVTCLTRHSAPGTPVNPLVVDVALLARALCYRAQSSRIYRTRFFVHTHTTVLRDIARTFACVMERVRWSLPRRLRLPVGEPKRPFAHGTRAKSMQSRDDIPLASEGYVTGGGIGFLGWVHFWGQG